MTFMNLKFYCEFFEKNNGQACEQLLEIVRPNRDVENFYYTEKDCIDFTLIYASVLYRDGDVSIVRAKCDNDTGIYTFKEMSFPDLELLEHMTSVLKMQQTYELGEPVDSIDPFCVM